MTISHLEIAGVPRPEIEIIVADDDEATKAASEFRGCGFIVTTEKVEVGA
jgi:hypothetical protein